MMRALSSRGGRGGSERADRDHQKIEARHIAWIILEAEPVRNDGVFGMFRRHIFPLPAALIARMDRLLSKFNYREPCFAMSEIKTASRRSAYHLRNFGLRRGIFEIETSRHISPVLILDEFEERPFTEDRRWRDSNLKIHTHPQTATIFVRVNARETFVCRFGQSRFCDVVMTTS
jgi:hypothetical protein